MLASPARRLLSLLSALPGLGMLRRVFAPHTPRLDGGRTELSRFAALNEIARIVSLGLDRAEAPPTFLAAAQLIAPVDAFAVLATPQGHPPRLLAAHALPSLPGANADGTDWLVPGLPLPTNEIAAWDLRDRSLDPPQIERARSAGFRTLACVPLSPHEERLGLLYLLSRSPNAFPASLWPTLQQIGDLAVVAVRLALLQNENAKRARQSTTLAELARIAHSSLEFEWVLPRLAHELARVLSFDRLTITTLSATDRDHVVRYRVDTVAYHAGVHTARLALDALLPDDPFHTGERRWGPAQAVISEAHPPAKPNARAFRSAMTVPVVVRDQVVATLGVEAQRISSYGDTDFQILEQVAAVVGPATENVRLLEQLSARVARSGVLKQAARAVAGSLRMDDQFADFCSHIYRLVPFEAASVTVSDDPHLPSRRWQVHHDRGSFVLRSHQLDPHERAEFEAALGNDPSQRLDGPGASRCLFPLDCQRPALFVVERARGQRFTDAEVDVLLEAAALLGVAVVTDAMYEAARRAAQSDALTGLANHARFREELSRELSRSARGRQSLAVVMLDIDGFKSVNDTFGHAVGDRILRNVADTLRMTSRLSDTIGRVGGDEFSLLLPETDAMDGQAVCRRLLLAMGRITGEAAPVSVSVGLAVFPQHGDTAALLVRRADVAMYAAKRSGGNRSVVWQPALDDEWQAKRLA